MRKLVLKENDIIYLDFPLFPYFIQLLQLSVSNPSINYLFSFFTRRIHQELTYLQVIYNGSLS